MGGSSRGLLVVLTLVAASCAKTQTTAPSADGAADTAPSAPVAPSTPASASPSVSSAVTAPSPSEAEAAATAAAEAWLALIDQGNYPASWDAAAGLFQRALARDEWASKVSSVRGPLGKRLTRQVQSAKFTTSLPGVPDGKYVVLIFSTSFENKLHAIETVTPLQDPGGAWRVAGYFLK